MKSYYFIDEKEQDKMILNNPYRPSKWYHPTPHEGWNGRYMEGWIAGRHFAAQKILDYIKEKKLNKDDFKELLLDTIMTKQIAEK